MKQSRQIERVAGSHLFGGFLTLAEYLIAFENMYVRNVPYERVLLRAPSLTSAPVTVDHFHDTEEANSRASPLVIFFRLREVTYIRERGN